MKYNDDRLITDGGLVVTRSALATLSACEPGLRNFTEAFADQPVKITEELCVTHAGDFEWEWAACNLLPHQLRNVWAQLDNVMRHARAQIAEIMEHATDTFERVHEVLLADQPSDVEGPLARSYDLLTDITDKIEVQLRDAINEITTENRARFFAQLAELQSELRVRAASTTKVVNQGNPKS